MSHDNVVTTVWDDVYGFDMSCVKPMVMSEPLVDNVEASMINTDSVPVYVCIQSRVITYRALT